MILYVTHVSTFVHESLVPDKVRLVGMDGVYTRGEDTVKGLVFA